MEHRNNSIRYFLFEIFKKLFYLLLFSILILLSIIIYNVISRSPGETILVPDNFIGFIYIIYDEQSGNIKKEKGKILHEIPSSGILKTNCKYDVRLNTFEHNIEFYYGKNRKLIPNISYIKKSVIRDTSAIVAIVKDYSQFLFQGLSFDEKEEFFMKKPYIINQIDSLKNLRKPAPPLTNIQYLNLNNN